MPSLAPLTAPPPSRRRFPLAFLGLAAIFALFGLGIVELFQLRFEHGDVYPPYSTLRNDPLGSAAFYEALASQSGLRVERSLRALDRLGQGPVSLFGRPPAVGTAPAVPLTFFYLGADPYEWPFLMERRAVDRLEEILRGGGRVVFTFKPGKTPLTADRLNHNRDEAAGVTPSPFPAPSATPGHKPPSRELRQREESRRADLLERWGLDFRRTEPSPSVPTPSPAPAPRRGNVFSFPHPSPGPTPTPTPAPVAIGQAQTARPVPGTSFADVGEAPWHTALDFRVDAPAAREAGWRSLYERDGKPVVVARSFGPAGGEIFLVSDSYFLSNEALRAEPRPALLAALVGNGRHLIFDESHQGVEESPGLMTLARRYGLQGALGAVGLLVALFIWRNVASLVPPPAPSADAQAAASMVTGRESAVGFLNLVKRGVPPRELLATCLTRWQAGASRRPPDAGTVARLQALADAEAARPARERGPAAVYRAMCAALRPGR